jgi:hypothetical protein
MTDRLVALVNKALSSRGVHVGGGRHVEMPDEWDGTGATPPGWTEAARLMEDGTVTLDVDESRAAERLPAEEAAELTALLESATRDRRLRTRDVGLEPDPLIKPGG